MNKPTKQQETQFVTAYVATALWSSTGTDSDEPLDKWAAQANIEEDSLKVMTYEALAFLWQYHAAIPDTLLEKAARDFWLTRNGHGAGFWDSPELWGDSSQLLTNAAHAAGTRTLLVSDKWTISQYPG